MVWIKKNGKVWYQFKIPYQQIRYICEIYSGHEIEILCWKSHKKNLNISIRRAYMGNRGIWVSKFQTKQMDVHYVLFFADDKIWTIQMSKLNSKMGSSDYTSFYAFYRWRSFFDLQGPRQEFKSWGINFLNSIYFIGESYILVKVATMVGSKKISWC